MVPAFSTFNKVLGMFVWGIVIMAIYFTNTWNTGYLPIVSNRVFDHFGGYYNVSRALDERGMYDHDKYMDYSAAYLGAANTIVYCAFFAIYTACITHVALFHRYEITMGFKNLWASFRRKKAAEGVEGGDYKDVHNRLMAAYPEGMHIYLFVLPFLPVVETLQKKRSISNQSLNAYSLGVVVFRCADCCCWLRIRRSGWMADLYHSRSGTVWCCPLHDLCDSRRHHQGHDRNRGYLERAGRVHRWVVGPGQCGMFYALTSMRPASRVPVYDHLLTYPL